MSKRKIGAALSAITMLAAGLLLAAVTPASASGSVTVRPTIVEGPVAVSPGTPVEYSIIAVNVAKSAVADISQVAVTEPSGFAYVAGSTEGSLNGDPAINGNLLTWTAANPAGGPITIAAQQALQFQFKATAGAPVGWYFAQVTVTLNGDGKIFKSSLEAPVHVVAGGQQS